MIALLAVLLAVDAGFATETHGPHAASPSLAAVSQPPPLREAKAVLADYAKAIGDEDLWRKHKSVRVKRQVSVKAMQLVSQQETLVARGGKLHDESQMPGMGTFRRGSDGRVAWAEDPIGGLRVLKDAEAEDVRIGAIWNSEWHLSDAYLKVTSIATPKTAPADKPLECVELSKKKGAPTQLCFDRATHLRAWEQGVQASQGGQVPYVTTFSDWRPVDGVQVWHHESVTVGPVTMEGQIMEIAFDEPVAAGLFALPRKK